MNELKLCQGTLLTEYEQGSWKNQFSRAVENSLSESHDNRTKSIKVFCSVIGRMNSDGREDDEIVKIGAELEWMLM